MKYCIVLIWVLCSLATDAAEKVKVGVYDFPPYAFVGEDVEGITKQVIAKMNAFQSQYEFVPVPTTSRRRYHDFSKHKFDMLIFESKEWGWQDFPVESTSPFVTGHEVYVALAKENRGQAFFSNFKHKTMIGVLGYHYGFAKFKTDLNYLNKHFHMIQTDGQRQSLELILHDRGDIAVLSREYLNFHFQQHPEDREKLLISDKFDQTYEHTVLIRRNKNIKREYIENMLKTMEKQQLFKSLWQQYDLTPLH